MYKLFAFTSPPQEQSWIIMAGGHVDESQFAHYAGFKKYFNADTTFGKRNVSNNNNYK